jgi:hypothetical protein
MISSKLCAEATEDHQFKLFLAARFYYSSMGGRGNPRQTARTTTEPTNRCSFSFWESNSQILLLV